MGAGGSDRRAVAHRAFIEDVVADARPDTALGASTGMLDRFAALPQTGAWIAITLPRRGGLCLASAAPVAPSGRVCRPGCGAARW